MKRLVVGLVCLALGMACTASAQEVAANKKQVDEFVKIIKSDKDGKRRAAALNGLGEIAQIRLVLVKPAVPAVVEALKDDNGEARRAAAQTLTYVEPYTKDRIPGLVGMLKEGEDRNGRLIAIIMLGRTQGGAPEAVVPLQQIKQREEAKAENMRDNETIQRVNEALVGINQYLFQGYIDTLKDDKDGKARVTAAAELAKIAQLKADQVKPAVGILVNALKDDEVEVRKSALVALTLAKGDPNEVVPGAIDVIKHLKEDRGVRIAAISLLGSYGPNAKGAAPFLEVLLARETKKSESDRDKELFDKLTEALTAIKK